MEQLSNYQSAHIDYIGSDTLSTALAVYLGPLSTELRMDFINKHWTKCLRERGIDLSWSSTEKVLIPSVTDEVGESGITLDNEEPPAPAAPAAVDDNGNGNGDMVDTTNDMKTDDQNGMSWYTATISLYKCRMMEARLCDIHQMLVYISIC